MKDKWSDRRQRNPWDTAKDKTKRALRKNSRAAREDAEERAKMPARSPEEWRTLDAPYVNTAGMVERDRTLRELKDKYRMEGDGYARDFGASDFLKVLSTRTPRAPDANAPARNAVEVYVDGGLSLKDVSVVS